MSRGRGVDCVDQCFSRPIHPPGLGMLCRSMQGPPKKRDADISLYQRGSLTNQVVTETRHARGTPGMGKKQPSSRSAQVFVRSVPHRIALHGGARVLVHRRGRLVLEGIGQTLRIQRDTRNQVRDAEQDRRGRPPEPQQELLLLARVRLPLVLARESALMPRLRRLARRVHCQEVLPRGLLGRARQKACAPLVVSRLV